MYGMARVGAAVPELRVADPKFNGEKILELIKSGAEDGVKILAFPELCMTAYTCGDLFFQSALQQEAEAALEWVANSARDLDILVVVGMPVRADSQTFNCGVAFHKGCILGVVPKTFLPNHNEFYEERWFSSALDLRSEEVLLCGQTVPMGTGLLFHCPHLPELAVGVEICEDLWCPVPPSSLQALGGANVILNLSASNELSAKGAYRRELIGGQSSRLISTYVYASAGMYESTTDLVFGGHSLIYENGALMAEIPPFQLESRLAWADVDIQLLMNSRRSTNSFMAHLHDLGVQRYKSIPVPISMESGPIRRAVSPSPFVPRDKAELEERCGEVFAIQRTGLARRLLHIGSRASVIAVSGGLDSTLALLCAAKAYDFLGWERRGITAVTMPGFGTTGRTHHNALELMKALGVTVKEIPIGEAVLHHFRDIGQDPERRDVVYENAQARERTQIVMDMANMVGGIVIGTGDLSELAMGYTTYNGDHMSMYNVNCSVPKTLVRALVGWVADSGQLDGHCRDILRDILHTPVSPELLPPGKEGDIAQKTEDLIGPYELLDFFLYHMIRSGFGPEKILFLAELAFQGSYGSQEIQKWLKLFYRRFFQQQFKRSCVPDGPKVGSVALSPRGDWRMPSDASPEAWLRCLEG